MTDNFMHLADLLCWNETDTSKLELLERRYLDALCYSLGIKLARLKARCPQLTEKVRARLARLSDDEVAWLVLRPAASRRIMTNLHGLEEVANFLAMRDPSGATDANVGAADGDAFLLGTIPVHSRMADKDAFRGLIQQIDSLAEKAAAICEPVGVFLKFNMRELILREEPQRAGFFSSSPQGYVGRAIITNGHLAMVDNVMLLEAIVHEATHGFVGMSEASGLSGSEDAVPWLSDNQPYDGLSRVTSPWTGTPLDIPTYLHACFVWWGLLHFWCQMREHGACDQARMRNRLSRALRGFEGDAFIKELEPFRHIVAAELMRVFESMSHALQRAFEPQTAEALPCQT